MPSATGSPPETTVSKDTPPASSVATEAKSISAPSSPSEKLKPEASQKRVAEVTSRSWGA